MSRDAAAGRVGGPGMWWVTLAWVIVGAALLIPESVVNAEPFSHATFDSVLAKHLRDGRVDYGGLARDRGPLDRYLGSTRDARPANWSREEQFAFWVNVYNARILEGVIRRPGLRSVRDIGKKLGVPTGAFFRQKFVAAGREVSFNDVEHEILRAKFHEPRVHFVLNCASASCPVLPEHPLTAIGLEAQLEHATTQFLTDRSRNRIDPARELRLSSIFKWYAEDFNAAAGSAPKFVERHWPGPDRVAPGLPVTYLDYDWSLNGTW